MEFTREGSIAVTEFSRYVEKVKPICIGLQKTLGNRIEFILHDLSKPEASVVFVVGNVTGRQLGAPATNTLIRAISQYGDEAEDMISYPSISRDGKVLKSSTIFIRNDSGKIIGCLCVNFDVTEFNAVTALIGELIATVNPDHHATHQDEIFAQGINEVVEDVIRYEIGKSKQSPSSMSKADKVEIIRSLDKKGIFDVKGSPEMVAGMLGTSVFTIYNYLKEARNEYK